MVAEPARRWLIGALLLLPWPAPPACAESPPPPADPDPSPAPSKDMLLYLAEFEDADGQWIDPLEVARDQHAAAAEPAPERAAGTEPQP